MGHLTGERGIGAALCLAGIAALVLALGFFHVLVLSGALAFFYLFVSERARLG